MIQISRHQKNMEKNFLSLKAFYVIATEHHFPPWCKVLQLSLKYVDNKCNIEFLMISFSLLSTIFRKPTQRFQSVLRIFQCLMIKSTAPAGKLCSHYVTIHELFCFVLLFGFDPPCGAQGFSIFCAVE